MKLATRLVTTAVTLICLLLAEALFAGSGNVPETSAPVVRAAAPIVVGTAGRGTASASTVATVLATPVAGASAPAVHHSSIGSVVLVVRQASATRWTSATVAATDGLGVWSRSAPDGPALALWAEGTPIQVTGSAHELSGRGWTPVRTPDGQNGWIASEYLGRAERVAVASAR